MTPSQRAARATEALDRIRAEHPTGEAAAHAAREFNVNRQYVHDCNKIRNCDPQLFDKILHGQISIQDAKRELKNAEIKTPKKRIYRRKNAGPKSLQVEQIVSPSVITKGEIQYMTVTTNWRNEIAALMADEKKIERALMDGILIRKNENE